jgi:hypothetical protein
VNDRFPLFALGGLLFFAVLGGLVLQSAKRGNFADDYSTFRSSPSGTRALFLALEQQHQDVHRLQKDFSLVKKGVNLALLGVQFVGDWTPEPRDAGVADLFLNDDAKEKTKKYKTYNTLRVTSEECDTLEKYIEGGGTVFLALDSPHENELLEALKIGIHAPESLLGLRTLAPSLPSLYTAGVERVESRVTGFLELPLDAVALLEDVILDEPVMAMVPHGRGRLIISTMPEAFSNAGILRADNAKLAFAIFGQLSSDAPVDIDEFHHGFTSERSAGEFAMRYGLHFAAAQFTFGLALWALALRRFGRIQTLSELRRTEGLDSLQATARLYSEGQHYAHSASVILKQLLADCARLAGAPAHASTLEVTQRLEARGRGALAAALQTTAQLAHQTSTEKQVIEVATLASTTRHAMHSKERP